MKMRAFGLVVAITLGLSLLGIARADHNGQHEIELGVSVPGNSLGTVRALENDLGRQLDSVRVFKFWNESFPTAEEQTLMNEGRDLIVSVNAARPGDPISWSAIANAAPGSALHNDMVSWANRIRPYEDQIYLTFQHEPETVGNIVKGNNTDFIAAWRKFMSIMAANGVQPKARVWIMTDYAFHVPASDRRDESKWYPGDSWVEAIAADAYNWHDCRPGIDVPWQTLRANLAPLRAFGAAHPNEQLMLTEIGSAEDENTPGRKAQWMRDMRGLFKEPGYEQFTLIAWFNLYHNGGPSDCDWRLSTGSDVLAAYRAIAQDPFYGGPTGGGGGGGGQTGEVIGSGNVDASGSPAPRWTSFAYTPTTSGSTTLTMGWTGVGVLKFDLRTQGGQWVASDTSASAPKTMTANLTAGTTYRVAVWSTWRDGNFTVRSSTGGGGNPAAPTVMSGTADNAGNAGPRWRAVNWTAPSSGTATVKLDWATASANLRIEVRTSGGAWVASDVSGADPKTLTFPVANGATYRLAAWAAGGSSTYTVTAAVN